MINSVIAGMAMINSVIAEMAMMAMINSIIAGMAMINSIILIAKLNDQRIRVRTRVTVASLHNDFASSPTRHIYLELVIL
jgi:hypothetical protein